jgi:hypothetical protein
LHMSLSLQKKMRLLKLAETFQDTCLITVIDEEAKLGRTPVGLVSAW